MSLISRTFKTISKKWKENDSLTNHCVEKSQMCNYFESILKMVELLKDLAATDIVACQIILFCYR